MHVKRDMQVPGLLRRLRPSQTTDGDGIVAIFTGNDVRAQAPPRRRWTPFSWGLQGPNRLAVSRDSIAMEPCGHPAR
jgi:hypothetical protein